MGTESQARERLKALADLDKKIVAVLGNSEKVVASIRNGKALGATPDAKQNFSQCIDDFNSNVEEVNKGLRGEVLRLHEASHQTLVPLNLPVQAVSFAAVKEQELWDAIREEPERMQE